MDWKMKLIITDSSPKVYEICGTSFVHPKLPKFPQEKPIHQHIIPSNSAIWLLLANTDWSNLKPTTFSTMKMFPRKGERTLYFEIMKSSLLVHSSVIKWDVEIPASGVMHIDNTTMSFYLHRGRLAGLRFCLEDDNTNACQPMLAPPIPSLYSMPPNPVLPGGYQHLYLPPPPMPYFLDTHSIPPTEASMNYLTMGLHYPSMYQSPYNLMPPTIPSPSTLYDKDPPIIPTLPNYTSIPGSPTYIPTLPKQQHEDINNSMAQNINNTINVPSAPSTSLIESSLQAPPTTPPLTSPNPLEDTAYISDETPLIDTNQKLTHSVIDSPTNERSSLISSQSSLKYVSPTRVGDLCFGELIGTGAFSQVFLGTYCGNPCAIKSFKTKVQESQVQREVSLLKELQHPNIIKFVGFVENTPDDCVLLTNYCARGSLYEVMHKLCSARVKQPRRVQRRSSLSRIPTEDQFREIKEQRSSIINELISGMHYLHHKVGLIHFDLNSKNILLDGDWSVNIGDFGLAIPMNDLKDAEVNRKMTGVGTLQWRAPELYKITAKKKALEAVQLTEKVDIYGFAIILWELFHLGEVLWDGVPDTEIKREVLKGTRPKLEESCPQAWQEIIEQCWHATPELRPSFEVLRNLKLKVEET